MKGALLVNKENALIGQIDCRRKQIFVAGNFQLVFDVTLVELSLTRRAHADVEEEENTKIDSNLPRPVATRKCRCSWRDSTISSSPCTPCSPNALQRPSDVFAPWRKIRATLLPSRLTRSSSLTRRRRRRCEPSRILAAATRRLDAASRTRPTRASRTRRSRRRTRADSRPLSSDLDRLSAWRDDSLRRPSTSSAP